MPIRWDALLVRHTARELREAVAGAHLRAIRFDRERRDVFLLFRDATVLWALHPERGHVRLLEPLEPVDGDYPSSGRLVDVTSAPDERLVHFELKRRRGGRAALIVELLGNQWNALVTEGEALTIRHALRLRRAGRELAVGSRYEPPPALERVGRDGDVPEGEWVAELEGCPADERARHLVRTFAWTSPLNAPALVGHGSLESGHRRWLDMIRETGLGRPVVLETERGPHPYPFPLEGVGHSPAPSLLAALAAVEAEAHPGADFRPSVGPADLARLERSVGRADRRRRKLEAELEELEDPASLRACADLILARYAEIPSGATQARLVGFDGTELHVRLDPARPPHESAARYYKQAAKSERARETLPTLIEQAEHRSAALATLLSRARVGAAAPSEVEAALGPDAPPKAPGGDAPSLPYRLYRSSGGIEIRVGRGARHNDDLTFRHSAPDDVWLHARHSAGAHVILRWSGPGAPPARDLREAATLAAVHSRARTSGSVPVDWTLRKYVRKPRKAPPGSVVPDRVKTVFVEPDASLPQRLEARRGVDPA